MSKMSKMSKMPDLVERLTKSERKRDCERKGRLRMDARKPGVDRVHPVLERFEACADHNDWMMCYDQVDESQYTLDQSLISCHKGLPILLQRKGKGSSEVERERRDWSRTGVEGDD